MSFDYEQLIGQTVTAEQLNKCLNGLPVFKYMTRNNIHHGKKYQPGLNVDLGDFKNPDKSEKLHCTTIDNSHLREYAKKYGYCASSVVIPSDALVFVEKTRFRCSKMILGETKYSYDLLMELFSEYIKSRDPSQFENDLLKIIEKNPDSIRYMDHQSRTPRMILRAIEKHGAMIEYIDPKSLTGNMVMAAVKQKGHLLKYAPDEILAYDHQIILESVKSCGDIEHRHAMMLEGDEKTMMEIIIHRPHLISKFTSNGPLCPPPGSLIRTPRMNLEAISRQGSLIKFMSPWEITPELTHAAIDQDYRAIGIVCKKLHLLNLQAASEGKELCVAHFIPDKYLTYDFPRHVTKRLLKSHLGSQLESQFGPQLESQFGPQLGSQLASQLESELQVHLSILEVKEPASNPGPAPVPMNLCVVIDRNPFLLQYIDKKFRTPEVILCAVSKHGLLIRFLEADEKTPDVLYAAVNQDPLSTQFIDPPAVPKTKVNMGILETAIKKDPRLTEFVDPQFKVPKIMSLIP